jgi:uncharacterized protein YdeI (YjbR/CyaY-like superfamily)
METERFYPATQQEWRQWLIENHAVKRSVQLVGYKKSSGKPSVAWSDAVDEALCFGWIDSTRRSVDDEQFVQLFTRRKPNSTWSKVNKEKIGRLISEGKMTQAGLDSIETAKNNGSWTILDEVEELTIPEDLEKELALRPGSRDFFTGLAKSVQKRMLHWIVMAKRGETRQKRILEIAEGLARLERPERFK